MSEAPRPSVPAIVIDTNTVLDWLLFDEPGVAPLTAAVQSGSVCWIACEEMRAECEHILSRKALARWRPQPERVTQAWARHAWILPTPQTAPTWPRCTDPDDQIFIDLAIAAGARWLITRDRALLRLRRRAAAYGVQVLRPEEWTPAAP
jgi:putative PIN family toxin of toxin-antitoxin system